MELGNVTLIIFFFQAEDGIRDGRVTGVQTCALPILNVTRCRAKYKALAPTLTERARRIWAATEAQAAGWGGITAVARATGISYSTIQRGLQELTANDQLAPDRIRRAGGGRTRTLDKDPHLWADR